MVNLKELGLFYATTSPYIEIKDIDGDGKIEIICSIKDPKAGVAMAVAPTTKEVYRWDKNNFMKVNEIRNWNIKDYPSAEL